MSDYRHDIPRAWVVWDYEDAPTSIVSMFECHAPGIPTSVALWPEDTHESEPPWFASPGPAADRYDATLSSGRRVSLWRVV